MTDLKISIVTPCYNSTGFLERLHSSLCRQSYRNFEWITVDDKSTDETLSLLLGLESPGAGGMKVFALPQNSGGGVATGVGVERSSNEALLIVDHDDELEPYALESIAEYWPQVSSDHSLAGLFFRRANPATGLAIGERLRTGTRFSFSWLSNVKPSISDGVVVMKRATAIRFFNSISLEGICLFGVPYSQATTGQQLLTGSEHPIVKYHRDNPLSQTNSVKISWKTVYTYAQAINSIDQYYLRRPLYWSRHLTATIKMAYRVHGSFWYHHRYFSHWNRALLSWLFMPAGIVMHLLSSPSVVQKLECFDFTKISELVDMRA